MHQIVDRVTGADDPGRDAYNTGHLYWLEGYRQPQDPHLDEKTALTYTAVWACRRVIAQTIASLGWHVFERSDDGRSRKPIEDDIAWMLGMQASPELNAFEWRQLMINDALSGNGFSEIERNNSGRPMWLHRICPSRVSLLRDDLGRLLYRVTNDGRDPSYLRPEDMFHLRGPSPDGLVGYSVVQMFRRSIGLGISTERYARTFFDLGPMPGGMLTVPSQMKKEARDELRESFQKMHGGSDKAGRVVVLWGDMKFQAADVVNDDAQFLQSRGYNVYDICFVPGTPIVTKSGLMPIESVCEGDEVLTHKGRWRKVTGVMQRQYDGEVVTMQAKGLPAITATPNHPMFVQMVKPNRSHCLEPDGEPAWIPAGELNARTTLAGGGCSRRRFANLTIPVMERSEVGTYEDGWLCGLYAADGSATDRQTVFYIGAHEQDITKQLVARLSAAFSGHISTTIVQGGSVHRTVIGSREVANRFGDFGHSSHTKRLPAWAMAQGSSFHRGFVEGLMAGDGHETNGYRRLKTTSFDLAWQLRIILWADGVNSSLVTVPPGRWSIEGREGDSREIYTVQWRASKNRRGTMGVGEGVNYFALENVSRSTYVGPVYNLQVDEDETYTTAGGVAHNCRIYGVPPHKIAQLERATFCVPGDAAVFAETGPKPASEVRVGEKVWSRAEQGHWQLSEVEAASCTGVAEVLEIRAGIRTLRCTANHKVPVRRATLIPWAGGAGRHILVDGVKCRKSWEIAWIDAGDIRPGDELLAANDFAAEGVRSCPTREECTVEFMEALGMVVGDGFFARSRGYKIAFGISHGENEDYVPHYVSAIEKEFTAGDGPYAMRNGGRVALKARKRDKNTTVFHSTPAYAELEQLGITGTAKTKRIPAWIFALAPDLKIAFLRGYLDADGTINKAGNVRYVSVNKQLLDDVRHLCVSVGIRVGNLISSEIASAFNGKEYRHTLWSIICTGDAGKRIGSHSEFCRDRTAAKLARKRGRVCKVYPCEQRRREVQDGVLYTQVLSVRSLGEMPVYDLSVADTHTFVCESVLVHNSNIEHQGIEFVQDCALPWSRRLEIEADVKLFGRINRGRRYTRLNLSTLLRGDTAAQTDAVTRRVNAGLYTINEGREYLDQNPEPSGLGDVTLIQGAMQPLERIINPPEPMPAPAAAQAGGDSGARPEPQPQNSAYGYCPQCGEPGVSRERRLNGYDTCANGHVYLSREAKLRPDAANNKASVAAAFTGLFAEVYARQLKVEADKARRADNRCSLQAWVAEFYDADLVARVTTTLTPVVTALLAAIGGKTEQAADLATRLAQDHATQSRADLQASGGRVVDSWESERPTKQAAQAVQILLGAQS